MSSYLLSDAAIPAFRRAVAADAALVRAISRAAYAKWATLIGREPWPMTADYDAALREHRIDLLQLEGHAIGLVEMIPHPDHLLIENVAVLPDFQGGGHGKRLMAHAEAVAQGMGYATIRLYTNARFAANVILYRRLGFAVEREEVIDIATMVHMAKTIGGAAAGGGLKPALRHVRRGLG